MIKFPFLENSQIYYSFLKFKEKILVLFMYNRGDFSSYKTKILEFKAEIKILV
jgi:hypothetical protein